MPISIDGSGSITGVSSLSNPSNIVVGTGVSIVSPSVNELAIRTNDVERIRVGPSGDIDIGKETSGRKTLTLNSQDDGAAILFRADAATRARIEVENGSTDLVFGVETAVTPTTRLRIDSNGRVTMPYQPIFYAYQSAGSTTTSTGIFNSTQWNTTLVNTGSHFSTSNGRFTAPVAGVYMFQIKTLIRHQSSTGAAEISLYKNGANVVERSFGYTVMVASGDHATITAIAYLSLNVNDFVQMGVHALSAGLDVYYGQNLGSFCGQLVG